MKGVLILTEGRSGSTWLGSLANSTGLLGRSGEWLDRLRRDKAIVAQGGAAYAEAAVARGTGETGFFAVKLFPRHVMWFQRRYGFDFIGHVRARHDVALVRLTRRDRLAQAISYARAMQSRQWTSRKDAPEARPVYDFQRILRSYLLIQRAYTYWESYVTLAGQEAAHFVYEDMIGAPEPYLRCLADHAGVADLPKVKTDLKILRNAETEAWRARFLAEAQAGDLAQLASGIRPVPRTPLNLARLALGRELKPYTYSY